MRHTLFAVATLVLFSAACSNDEREPSFVTEAQAATAQGPKDYGWRTTPQYPAVEAGAREYH